LKKILEAKNKTVFIGGQVLGCNAKNAEKIKNKVDCFLYIGDGTFHPIEVSLKTQKPVFVISDKKLIEFDKKNIEKYQKQLNVAKVKYLSAEKIGILVSTKEYQNKMSEAKILKKKLEKSGKEAFIFIFDQLDFGQLENFPFVEVWVNTACPRLRDDYEKFNKAVINIEDLE